MDGSRRAFVTAGLAAMAVAAVALPENAMAVAGADIQARPRALVMVSATMYGPDGEIHHLGPLEMVGDETQGYALQFDCDPIELQFGHYRVHFSAMQPESGAGTVQGDKAQSVGQPGDLKAGRPASGASQGSTTPGAKAVDATKQSWLKRMMWPLLRPVFG